MPDKPTAVKMVELGETLERLQPTVDVIRELGKKLVAPDDFLIYPVLMAAVLYEMSDGNYEVARENYRDFSDIVIFAFGVMRAEARVKAMRDDKEPPKESVH